MLSMSYLDLMCTFVHYFDLTIYSTDSASNLPTYLCSDHICNRKWFLKALGVKEFHKLLAGFEDKSAQAVCTFAYCEGPGKEPIVFQGRTEVSSLSRFPGWSGTHFADAGGRARLCHVVDRRTLVSCTTCS